MAELTVKSPVKLRFSTSSSADPLQSTSEPPTENGSESGQQLPIGLLEQTGNENLMATVEPEQPVPPQDRDTNHGKKLSGKLTTQYVMPDGSVITGKGLGRGRPGVKRGPRRSKNSEDASVEGTPVPTTQAQTPTSQTVPTSTKRKREGSDISDVRMRSLSSSLQSRESSVEYNPTATQTRSGRQTQKPIPLITPTPAPSSSATPTSKKVATPTTLTPNLKTHPKIKRKVYRGKEQFALCEHCLRGFGPPGNVIVFCDACNKCWHQKCHQPQISKEVVTDAKAEWFCATCDKILHGNKKSKKTAQVKPNVTSIPAAPIPPPVQRFGPPLVGAIALTLDQRKKYLETLSREQLINLALRAGDLAPQMPIFETPIPLPRPPNQTQPQFTSNYVTPVFEIPNLDKPREKIESKANYMPKDEGYDDSFDEHAALYPRTGEGVKIPSEREDLNILLEGPDSRTFSHWIRGMPSRWRLILFRSGDTLPTPLSHTRNDGMTGKHARVCCDQECLTKTYIMINICVDEGGFCVNTARELWQQS